MVKTSQSISVNLQPALFHTVDQKMCPRQAWKQNLSFSQMLESYDHIYVCIYYICYVCVYIFTIYTHIHIQVFYTVYFYGKFLFFLFF